MYTNAIFFLPLIAKSFYWVFLSWRFSLCSYIHVNFAVKCIVYMHWTVHSWDTLTPFMFDSVILLLGPF